MISNIEKIIIVVLLLFIIILLYNNCNTSENFECSFLQDEEHYKPIYVLQKPGDIINPLNSIYYIIR